MFSSVNKPGHPLPNYPGDESHRPIPPEKPTPPEGPAHPEKPHSPVSPGHPDHPEKPEKAITIIVNGVDNLIQAGIKVLSYEDVVRLAYPNYSGADSIIYTVVFSNGPIENKKGILVKGDVAHIREGMIFNVGKSNKS